MRKILMIIAIIYPGCVLSQNPVHAADSLLLDAAYEKVIAVVDKNIKGSDHSQTVMLENKKAEAWIRMGKLEEPEKLLNEIVSLPALSPHLLGVTKSNQGLLYLNLGRNDLALQALQEAIQYFEQENNAASLEAAQAISYLGQVYKATGKDAQAEEQLQMALALRQRVLKDDHELIAASYNDLGFAYAHIDNDKALDYYEKALQIYQRLHGSDHPKIAIASTNIGLVYRDLELYGDAINNFETALKIWEKVYEQAHPVKAFVLYNLGETYLKIGNSEAARGYYEKALSIYRSSYEGKHPDISRVLNAIGNIERSAGKYDAALQYFQQALKANVSDFESDDESINPGTQNFYHGHVLLYSLLYKAETFEARHYGKSLKFHDLLLGLKTLQSCDSLIDRLRHHSTNESDKISLGAIATEVYADGVRIAHETAMVAFKKKPYEELAFYFAEKSKSAVLQEAISESNAKSFAGIPASLLEEERDLKSAIALTERKLAQKPSDVEEKHLRETAFHLNRKYDSFVRNLEKKFPEYFNLKFNEVSSTVGQLSNLLDSKTAVLSYFTDEKNSRLYIFLITKKSFKVIDRPLSADFDKYITGLRNGIYFNVMPAYTLAARSLGRLLIPNHIAVSIKDLVIIPTGRMSIIPFETLLVKENNEHKSYKDLPYLLKRFTVRYEFSSGLMLQEARQEKIKSSSIFLCAPVVFPGKDNLSPLPATESEVNEIAQLFASKQLDHALYTRDDANELLIKSHTLKNYSLLHFATHGIVDETEPELSRIFLQNKSRSEDGNLFAGEIYNLQLKANLVTLSACETGLGKISKGEGVIGLSRALVYAGAKNIIVSFWSVADESTAMLMEDFYKVLLDQPAAGYGESLKSAKLKLMESEKYSSPFYWAPFILIGF